MPGSLPILTDPYRPDFARIGAERANIIRGGYGAAMGDVMRGASTAARAADVTGGAAAGREAAAAAAPALGRLGHQMTTGLAEARARTRSEQDAYETAMSQRRQDIIGTALNVLGTGGGMLTSALGGIGGIFGGVSSGGAQHLPGEGGPMGIGGGRGGGAGSMERPAYARGGFDANSFFPESDSDKSTTLSLPMPGGALSGGRLGSRGGLGGMLSPMGARSAGAPLGGLLGGSSLGDLAGAAAPIAGMINPLAGLGLGMFSGLGRR